MIQQLIDQHLSSITTQIRAKYPSEMESYATVSYTHLDVYKRQSENSADNSYARKSKKTYEVHNLCDKRLNQ